MYSDALRERLETNGIEPGDTVEVTTAETDYTGTVMPRADQGNADALVIKLDNGYNIGIEHDTIQEITKIDEPDAGEPDRAEELPHDPDQPDITILHTGGTIASRVSYETGGVKAAFEPADLFELYPELFEMANIDAELVAQMYSGDMEPEHWQQIAQAVAEHREDADGIIIGHGTDTMQFTAAALSFMLENIDIPVVLTGAQRSSDRPSSDAAVNLKGSIQYIRDGDPGVYIAMHENMSDDTVAVHRGTKVRKMHTSRRDTFTSINEEPVATVDVEDRTTEIRSRTGTPDGEFRLRDELNTDVGLLKTAPGLETDLIEYYDRYDGIVLEGTGLGHFPVNQYDERTEHHEDNLEVISDIADEKPVVMTSQCLNGRVNMNVYNYGVKLQQAGVIPGADMLPGTAYVKLMWCLGQADDPETAEELFATNIAGEINERETYDAFQG